MFFLKNISKLPFNTIRETRLQTLQYSVIHNTIACNQWLKESKLKKLTLAHTVPKSMTSHTFSVIVKKTKTF